MSADILVLDVPSENRAGLRANLQKAKNIATLEIPKVLDASLDSVPQWIACDPVSGSRLADFLTATPALPPHLWAELARTALIGCAALRSQGIQAFQMSENTFVIDRTDVHMADVWAGSMQESDLYPAERTRLVDVTATDDKLAIGRILTLAMGVDLHTDDGELRAALDNGFNQGHIDFVKSLTASNAAARPTTEKALRAIPGRNPEWSIPVFALDKPGRQRAKRRAQKGVLWAGAAVLAAAAVAGGFVFLSGGSNSSDGDTASAPSPQPTSLDPVIELRLTLAKGEAEPEVFTDVDEYSFRYCYPEANLRTDEIPERLVFQRLVGDEWETDPDIDVRVVPSQRCPDGESAVTLTAPAPLADSLTEAWTSCQDFRVLIPRLSSDKRAPIRFCLQQREVSNQSTDS